MTRREWLDARRGGVGGSDVAAILGVSKYATPYTLWADKKGLLPYKEDTEATRQGRDLEEYAARRFTEETGKKVRHDNRTIRNPLYPYSYAHIDRRLTGINAGLECKTCSPYRLSEFAGGEYPPEYYVQCLHYLAVTGWDEWYLAVVILGAAFNTYVIRRADVLDDMKMVEESVTAFWEKHVLTGLPPDPDGLPPTSEAINAVYKDANEGSADLVEFNDSFVKIARIKYEMKTLEREKECHEQKIKMAMGANIYGICGEWTAAWKPRKDGVRVFSIK